MHFFKYFNDRRVYCRLIKQIIQIEVLIDRCVQQTVSDRASLAKLLVH